jgi:glutathione S-transferase
MPGSERDLPVLWQFRLSMYPEKVRWALDYKGVPHVRRSVLPGPHVASLLPRFGQKSMPVLRHGGRTIRNSGPILEYLESRFPQRPLLPPDPDRRRRVLELQEQFDAAGDHVRRAYFLEFLSDPGYAADCFSTGFGTLTRRLYRAAFPLIRAVMHLDMKITRTRAEASLHQTQATMDYIAEHCGRDRYLVGDGFTLADLTAATMLLAVALPDQYPVTFPQPRPPAVERWLARWADHPATDWVREMYRRHRGQSCAVRDLPEAA